MMTNRERILAILEKRHPDRIPWIPRLEIWHQAHTIRGTLPEKYRDLSLREIEHDLRTGTPARQGGVFQIQYHHVDIKHQAVGRETTTTYTTPVGKVYTIQRSSDTLTQGGVASSLVVSHMIKDLDDYKVVEYIFNNATVSPTYDAYSAYDQQIGPDGLPMVSIGPDPMYRILQTLIGFNNAFYHLYDYRTQVLHLYDVITEFTTKIQQVVLDSPARLIQHGEHFDAKMTPPNIYREFMLPYFQEFTEKLHDKGKSITCHADADLSNLLELIIDS
ncbi:MAG: uroporphyrinogen decarboxylase family protein, partial [Anaerolineae bacterium]|nr:uroporphyrinogen decarboxylase family protein [Anaerolineae bacterium]